MPAATPAMSRSLPHDGAAGSALSAAGAAGAAVAWVSAMVTWYAPASFCYSFRVTQMCEETPETIPETLRGVSVVLTERDLLEQIAGQQADLLQQVGLLVAELARYKPLLDRAEKRSRGWGMLGSTR